MKLIIKILKYTFVFIVSLYCFFFIATEILLFFVSSDIDLSIQPVSNIALKTSGIKLPKKHEVLYRFHSERDGDSTHWLIISKDPFKIPCTDSNFIAVENGEFFNDHISNQSYKIEPKDVIFSHYYYWEINGNLDSSNGKTIILIEYLKTKYFYYLYFAFTIRVS